jgi:P-type Cu+ transporter
MTTLAAADHVELAISGMTCAACAARIEKKLNRLDGVTAVVNYATERASVDFDGGSADTTKLIETVSSIGYGAALPNADHDPEEHARVALRRLKISAALAAPVLALSMIPGLQFDGWQWVCLAFATPVATWGAWPFHRSAWKNASHGATTMDTLVSLGVIAAFGWSLYALFFGGAGALNMRMTYGKSAHQHGHSAEIYLEVACAVTVFLLAGRYLESRARRHAGSAVRALAALGAKEAALLDTDGSERLVAIDDVRVGDRFVVRAGEKVATDGVIESGYSAIDASLITGESQPVDVEPGVAVVGATMNISGRLVVRATRVGSDTALAQIGRLVNAAQSGKADVQRLADKVSSIFVPVVLVLSAVTLGAWLVSGAAANKAFTAAVAVLVVACPCALGLATPTALLVGTGRGAQLGILIKSAAVLEDTRRVDTVVLDKTGTVTSGAMSVASVRVHDASRDEVLRYAAAVEIGSQHPVARALVVAGGAHGTTSMSDFVSVDGKGVRAVIDGEPVLVGKLSWLAAEGLGAFAEEAPAGEIGTVVGVGYRGAVRGVITVADSVKPSSAAAVAQFRHLGLRPVLLTGDNRATALSVAKAVGIDEADVFADVLPADKVAVVQQLQTDGAVVAMVGDGVNDAAALTRADIGIAMGTGTDVAIEASDLTVVGGDLVVAGDAIRLARRTLAVIKGNLFWAFAYNVAAIPFAASGRLNPVIAGGAMAASSLFVVGNSWRLRRFT